MKKNKMEILPFDINLFLTGKYRAVTQSGLKVNILTTNSDEKTYKILGHIGKSTQLESWSISGKYFHRNKDVNYNDLTLISN